MRNGLCGLVLVAALGGCASDAVDDAATQPTVAATPTADGSAAARALTDATAPVLEEPVTAFEALGHLDDSPVYRVSGVADIDTPGWTATAQVYFPGQPGATPRTMDAKSVGSKVWMKFRDWPKNQRGCWLTMRTPLERPFGFAALQPQEPGYLGLLGDLRAGGFLDESRTRIAADLDLEYAMGVQTATLQKTLGATAGQLRGRRVPVQVSIADGRLAALHIAGADLQRELAAAGADLDDEVADGVRRLRLEIRYAEGDGPTDIEVPSPTSVVGAGKCRAAALVNP